MRCAASESHILRPSHGSMLWINADGFFPFQQALRGTLVPSHLISAVGACLLGSRKLRTALGRLMVRSRLALVGLFATASLLSGSGVPLRDGGIHRSALASLAKACAGRGIAEGRFTAVQEAPIPPGEEARPCPPKSARGVRAARRIEELAALDASPSALRAKALLQVSRGEVEEAVLLLEAAAAKAPGEQELRSDLAAAYLARAVRRSRASDLPRSLAAAEAAIELAPQFCPALFNRAETLSRLHLRDQARAGWELYLARCSGDAWEEAARTRLGEQQTPTLAEEWQAELPAFQSASEAAVRRAPAVVRRLPHLTRHFAEERLLPEWAEATERGDRATAARRLALARAIGAALAESARDRMIHDAVEAIARAAASPDQRALRHLVTGHVAYGSAMELYYAQRLDEALPLLEEAARSLRKGGSPFAGWAEFHRAICLHYLAPERAAEELVRLRRSVSADSFPGLVGRIGWMLGTIQNNSGRPEEALRLYDSALARLESTLGRQTSSFLHMLKAECHLSLGNLEQAWTERLPALAATARSGDHRRRHAPLYEAAEALLQQGNAVVALAFADEALGNASAWGNPTALAEAGLQRGRALHLLGRRDEALAQLDEAHRHAEAMPPSALRQRIAGSVALARGEALLASDPAAAREALSDALASRLDNGYLFQLTRLLTTRARAHLALGEVPAAEADLVAAIAEHERIRFDLRSVERRSAYFEQAQSAFDEMVRLQLDVHRDPAAALTFAERARARALLDLSRFGREAAEAEPSTGALPSPLAPGEIAARAPEGVALVQYAVLPDRLVAWVQRHGMPPVYVPIASRAAGVSRAIAALANTIARKAPEWETRDAAAALHDLLIRPLGHTLAPGEPIAVVPDRQLAGVPFAALLDRRKGRFLVEEREIVIAPSATLFVTASERSRALGAVPPESVLTVGDPAFDRRRHQRLARLPAADEEAAAIAALYPRAEHLRKAEATADAFLTAAGRHAVVHFAGHSLLNPAVPWRSFLLFAPEVEHDGALYAHEFLGRLLPGTRVVVLSACRTLDLGAGREALTGLAAAFLAAGPASIVASLWEVDDDATRELMTTFHAALIRGASPGAALRDAQLRLLASSNPHLRAPASWAGFAVVGGTFEPAAQRERE